MSHQLDCDTYCRRLHRIMKGEPLCNESDLIDGHPGYRLSSWYLAQMIPPRGGRLVRELDKALAIGADVDSGRYVRFASPGYSNAWIFWMPLGALFAIAAVADAVSVFGGNRDLSHILLIPVATLLAVLGVGAGSALRFLRRVGGPLPRLYCFENGVVVSVRGVLQYFRWVDLSIDRKDWASGSGEYRESGTAFTATTANGTTVFTFMGDEPSRAGLHDVKRLHRAAVERATGNPGPLLH